MIATGTATEAERASLLDRVPQSLRAVPQWVVWRYVERDGKRTKVPVDAKSGATASSTDPSTWASFDDALAATTRLPSIEGVGFVFTERDPFCGIDLDECIVGGKVVSGAREIIDAFATYTEISPSGNGVKLIAEARKPEGARCRSTRVEGFKQIEVYDTGRFFTVTGRHWAGTPKKVERRQRELEALCAQLWPANAPRRAADASTAAGFDGDDDALLEAARSAKNADLFSALWRGDTSNHGGDDSAADLALCNILAFWTGPDAARIDRLFRRSGLMRPKWDEKRGEQTYGQGTIERAVADRTEFYSAERSGTRRRSAAGARSATDDADDPVELGQRDPASGRLVLSPKRTLPTAEAYVREFHDHAEGRTLHAHHGVLLEWRDNRYREVEDESIRHRLQPWLHAALRPSVDGRKAGASLVDFESNPATVHAVLATIRSLVHLPAETSFPTWLGDGVDRPPAREILPCRSMSLHLPTGRVLAPTPALFTVNALDFDHDPDAEAPRRWTEFLDEVFGDDAECRNALQDWFGYCLVPDTSQQKILLLVGPRRSGKGTIGRVLTQLVGPGNVAAPTTGSLAGAFGLQPLLGKSLAIVSDARFGGDGVGTVVERLLSVSGEDNITVDRKFLGAVHTKLPTRFIILTNELPRLNDASTALAGRFIVLKLTRSFYGREDVGLTERLTAELPGILNWAIDGWKRLRARGRFAQPLSSQEAIRDLADLASPVSAFVRERCVIGAGARAIVDDLFRAWQEWCGQDGRTHVANKQVFGRDLLAAVPGVKRRRGTGMQSFYDGLALRGEVR